MLWFKKKKQLKELKALDNKVEKELSKNDKKIDKTVNEAKRVASRAVEVINENHFTIKIFQATGGKLKELK